MTDRRPPIIVAGPAETLPDVVARLVAAGRAAGPVDLVVPRESGLLLTAGEFRQLKDVIDRDRLAVTLYCDDALRTQLAGLMGLPARRIPPGWLAAARQAPPPAPPVPPRAPAPPPAAPPSRSALAPRPPLPPVAQPGTPPRPEWATRLPSPVEERRQGPPPPVGPLPADGPEGPSFDRIVDRKHRGGGFPRWLGFTLGVLLLLALAAVAAALLLPRATVALTLQHAPVAGAIPFDVTATGAPLDGGAAIALAGTPLETDLAFETSIPASGLNLEPDDPAASAVVFANPGPQAVAGPAGTELDGGVMTFLLDAEVLVPAADPATGRAGNASGAATAAAPGGTGNVGAGEIGGRLASGVYYSNRGGAAAGGSDIELKVVAAADLAALQAQAEAALTPGSGAFSDLPEGTRLLPSTVESLSETVTYSAREGEPADTVGVNAVRQIRGLGFDEAAAREAVAAGAPGALAAQVPAGFRLAPESVEIAAITPVSDAPEGSRFTAEVSADAIASFTEADARALAERLAGADDAAAAAVLAATPGVKGFQIEYRAEWLPDWLPQRLPGDASRIRIEVAA
ncbi:MAG: hypothetical protein ACKOWF_14490 [Chloroflexota bacterium]